MKNLLITGIASLAVLLFADAARAQNPFHGLESVLSPGDTIFVTDDFGNRTRGRLEGIGASIRLSVDGVSREWSPQQVKEIRRRGDSVVNGLKLGMVTGGSVGAIFGSAVAALLENEGHDPLGPFLAILGLGIGIGGGIGVGLDAAIPGSTVVYRRERRTLSISPAVSPAAQSVRVALRF